MKRTITLMFATAIACSVFPVGFGSSSHVSLVPKVLAMEGCSVASLRGAYGIYRTGTTAIGPLAGIGIATFDGAGTSTAIQTVRKNGVTTSDLFTDSPFIAPYEIDQSCAGRFLHPDGSIFAEFVVVDKGKELVIISLNSGNTITGVMKKIDED